MAIVPLVKDGRTLGALVLEAAEAKGLTLEEARNLTVLGAVVTSSLELVWQFAEVDKRARTDPLTGLWNRHHFGEQLQRTLNDTERRCRSCWWTSITSSASTTRGDTKQGTRS